MSSIPAASLNRRSPYGLPYVNDQPAQKIQMNNVRMEVDDISETNRGQLWKDYDADAHNTAVKLVAENEFPGFWEDLLGKASTTCALVGLGCLVAMLTFGSVGAIAVPVSLLCALGYVGSEMVRSKARCLRKHDLNRNKLEVMLYAMADASRWGFYPVAMHDNQAVEVREGLQHPVNLPRAAEDEEDAEGAEDGAAAPRPTAANARAQGQTPAGAAGQREAGPSAPAQNEAPAAAAEHDEGVGAGPRAETAAGKSRQGEARSGAKAQAAAAAKAARTAEGPVNALQSPPGPMPASAQRLQPENKTPAVEEIVPAPLPEEKKKTGWFS
jgi:hypothetical protein